MEKQVTDTFSEYLLNILVILILLGFHKLCWYRQGVNDQICRLYLQLVSQGSSKRV
jgi:hypothetical protein